VALTEAEREYVEAEMNSASAPTSHVTSMGGLEGITRGPEPVTETGTTPSALSSFFIAEALWSDNRADEAIPFYERAFEDGSTRGAYQLGWLYYVMNDTVHADRWWSQAAQDGYVDADYYLGNLRWANGRPDQAVQNYIAAAESRHVSAAYQLAFCLLVEQGDVPGAEYWWGVAAGQGHKDADFYLGELRWSEGRPDQAVGNYEAAASAGHAQAAYRLGDLLFHVRQDKPGAEHWWGVAAAQGHRDADFRLGELRSSEGRPDEAVGNYQAAAIGGHAQAAFQLGELLLDVRHDKPGAEYWWGVAAAHGHNDADFRLGELRWGEGRPDEAVGNYEAAARAGHAQAAHRLGDLLLHERHDERGAEYWYHQASDLQNVSRSAPDDPDH
jgi:TPR repeat protein